MLPPSPRLIVEPDDSLEPVLEFMNSAQSSLLIKQFTFTEPDLIAAVIDRKKAGVEVRVMLNAKRSGGDRANDGTTSNSSARELLCNGRAASST